MKWRSTIQDFNSFGIYRWVILYQSAIGLVTLPIGIFNAAKGNSLGGWESICAVSSLCTAYLTFTASQWRKTAQLQQAERAVAELMIRDLTEKLNELEAPHGDCPHCPDNFKMGFAQAIAEVNKRKERKEAAARPGLRLVTADTATE